MNKKESIEAVCAIVGLAYQSIGEFEHSSDCFCSVGGIDDANYRNEGKAIEYVRLAVVRALKEDGYKIDSCFNQETGEILRA